MEGTLTFDIEADELDLFIEDVNELLQAMETGILELEESAGGETLNSIFRAAHTLKAMGGAVGHHSMAELTHTVETLFDRMRGGEVTPTPGLTDELLNVVDILRAQRDEVINQQPSGIDVEAVLDRLRTLSEAGQDDGRGDTPAATTQYQLTPEDLKQVEAHMEAGETILEVQASVFAAAFAPAARLMQAIMALEDAGQVIAQKPTQSDLFDDDHDGSLWAILATDMPDAAVVELLADVTDFGNIRVQTFEMVQEDPLAEPDPTQVVKPRKAPAAVGPTVETTVRISVERLDTLMNLVGEMVTDRNRLTQIEQTLHTQYGRSGAAGDLTDMTGHFSRVIDQLQEEVMRARMLPIGNLFQKFPRLVRDVSRAAGKEIKLVIRGETTELDRSVIEGIGDPLMHLLRNAVDHGIEHPQDRVAAGKPALGTIQLTAEHVEGQIVITVADDGGGIDPDRVRQAAVRRGLLGAEEAAELDDNGAIHLIFMPNVSTVEKVTDISGRGVGMDVVRTNVEQLGGMVVVESELGKGTTFRLALPLTLAIMQSMLVVLGSDVYAIPLTGIIDSLYLADVTVSTAKGSKVIQWRNSVLPLLDLRDFFAHTHIAPVAEGSRRAVVTVSWGKLNLGLVVDRIIGQQEIVVKSLSSVIGNLAGLSGCAILGDGRVALIIDIPSLVNTAARVRK